MPAIIVYASKVAAFAGLHPYADSKQAMLDQWYAWDRKGCTEAILNFASVRAADFVLDDPAEKKVFVAAYERGMAASNAEALEQVIQAIPDPRIRDTVRSEVNKDRGTRDESMALDEVEKRHDTRITERNAQLFSKTIAILEDTSVRIVGRVDGWRKDFGEVVEVKNRMRRFFDRVPLYERVQVQVYMWLTGARVCRFVQRFNGEVREETIDADPTFLETTLWPSLKDAVSHLSLLASGDEDAQRKIISQGILPTQYVQNWAHKNGGRVASSSAIKCPEKNT